MKPTPKVAAAGIGGSATLILLWACRQAGVEMDELTANAFVVVGAVVAGWLKRG